MKDAFYSEPIPDVDPEKGPAPWDLHRVLPDDLVELDEVDVLPDELAGFDGAGLDEGLPSIDDVADEAAGSSAYKTPSKLP